MRFDKFWLKMVFPLLSSKSVGNFNVGYLPAPLSHTYRNEKSQGKKLKFIKQLGEPQFFFLKESMTTQTKRRLQGLVGTGNGRQEWLSKSPIGPLLKFWGMTLHTLQHLPKKPLSTVGEFFTVLTSFYYHVCFDTGVNRTEDAANQSCYGKILFSSSFHFVIHYALLSSELLWFTVDSDCFLFNPSFRHEQSKEDNNKERGS